MEKEKKIYILRGVSGSGKSTLARELAGENGVVLSTDDFFINPTTGGYDYNTQALPKAHYWNQIRTKIAMQKSTSPIVIDNMNLTAWDARPYILLAQEYDYAPKIVEPQTPWRMDPEELAKHSSHVTNANAIKQMLGKMEDYSVDDAIKSTAPVGHVELDDRDKKRVEQRLVDAEEESQYKKNKNNINAKTDGAAHIKSNGSLLVQVTKNDGQKQTFKPVIIKSSDWTTFLKAACNKINAKFTPKARVFTVRGEEISKVEDLEPNIQLVVSEKGVDFIPMALKMTAAERREAKMKKALDQTNEMLQAISTNDNDNNKSYQNKHKNNSRGWEKLPLGISEILDGFLYLGNVRDAHSEEQLQQFEISHILNMSNDASNSNFDFITYKRIPIADDEFQNVGPVLDLCIDFIDSVKSTNGRVLVHCTKGKSRSVTVIVAYLLKSYKLSLKEAYRLVKSKREKIRPNSNFIRQLMQLEKQINGVVTLDWVDVESEQKSILDWLQKNSVPNKPPTHFWWEVLSKSKYHIAQEKLDELFAEFAKSALVRNEPLKLVELRGQTFKLHLDLDVKMEENSWKEMEILELFLPEILNAVNTKFPNQEASFVCSGLVGPFYTLSNADVNFKYGYHLVWPNIVINEQQLAEFLQSLAQTFAAMQESKEYPENFPMEAITANNTWEEIFDYSLIENDSGIRMLGSQKVFSCKVCQKNDEAKKKTKNTKSSKIVDDAPCKFCNDTGMLDSRVHKFMGVYDASGKLNEVKNKQLAATDDLRVLAEKLSLLSILDRTLDLTPKAKAPKKKQSDVLETQQFLRGEGEEELKNKFKLKVSRHQEYTNLLQFSYGKTSVDFAHPIVQECRGLILDARNNWSVVAFPYAKFFNWGEALGTDIDWSTASVTEKIDGSLAIMYWYKDKWHVASSATADGSAVLGKDLIFADLFWEIWNKNGYKLPEENHCTYMFELFSPKCPVVVKADRESIILHGVRDNKTFEELEPKPVAEKYNWECVQAFEFSSLQQVLEASKRLNPAQQEGFVVRDSEFNRIKVKSPQYVALAHLNFSDSISLNARHMLQIVVKNEGSEFLVHFPHFKQLYQLVQIALNNLIGKLDRALNPDHEDENDEENSVGFDRLVTEMKQRKVEDIREFLSEFEDLDLLFGLLNIGLEASAEDDNKHSHYVKPSQNVVKGQKISKKEKTQMKRDRQRKGANKFE